MHARHWYARTVFFVKDCSTAIRFYKSIGFNENWNFADSGKVVAAEVALNGIIIILNENQFKAGMGRLFISLANGETKEYLASVETYLDKIEDVYWGMPTKAIRDTDGNEILFYDDDLGE